jgi:hypothetical protein
MAVKTSLFTPVGAFRSKKILSLGVMSIFDACGQEMLHNEPQIAQTLRAVGTS